MLSKRLIYVFIAIVPFYICLLYFPGFSGTFYLDDFHTLEPLAALGGVESLDKAIYYIFSGRAGPTGRPFSLLTFLANSRVWPVEAFWFLVTNVIIHAVNSILAFLVLKELLIQAKIENKESGLIALSVVLLWAIHPYHVSTVLYTVQRMTMLSSLFTLLILLTYLHFRVALNSNNLKKISLCIMLGPILFLLGLLSKETIVVIPIQLLIIKQFLELANPEICKESRLYKFHSFVLIASALIVLIYPIKMLLEYYSGVIFDFQASGSHRGFTPAERFFTEQKVVFEYLEGILMPKLQGAGVFYDKYPISKSLFEPISTLFCFFFHCAAIAIAIFFRKAKPLIFLSVLWFYGSLYLESSFLMLELKFEHRNYLPSLGIIGLVVLALAQFPKASQKVIAVLGIALVFSLFLAARANLWGNPFQAAGVWATNNPYSPRVMENAARQSVIYGNDISAARAYLKKAAKLSGTAAMQIKYIAASCDELSSTSVDWAQISKALKVDPPDGSLHNTLEKLLQSKVNGDCHIISSEEYIALLDAYRDNKYYANKLGLYYMDEYQVRLLLSEDKYEEAMQFELSTLSKTMPIAMAIRRAGFIATMGYPELAEKSLRVRLVLAKDIEGESSFEYQQAHEVYQKIKQEVDDENGAGDG